MKHIKKERPKIKDYGNISGAGAYDYILDVNGYMNYLEQQLRISNMPFASYPLHSRGVTNKMVQTRNFIIKYIDTFGNPPTYQNIAGAFNIKKTAAYSRAKHFRELMVRRK